MNIDERDSALLERRKQLRNYIIETYPVLDEFVFIPEYKKTTFSTKKRKYRKPPNKFRNYYRRAISTNKEITISEDVFNEMLKHPCMYCGEKVIGLDRIDSKKGYTFMNCQPCCQHCNRVKWTYSDERFRNTLFNIAKHNNWIKEE